MPVLEVKMPNSLKDGHTHACPHSERNAGTKTSVKSLDYGQTCKTCGLSNPPLVDANGKTLGDKGFDSDTARNWHPVIMTSTQLERMRKDYPFVTFEVIA